MYLKDKRYTYFFGLMAVLIMLLSISVVSCCTCPKPNGNGYGTCKVYGYVWHDIDGDNQRDANEGIPGYNTKVYNQDYTFTDLDGRDSYGKYMITSVPTPAPYTVEASAPGYGTETRSISLSSAETQHREDFKLTPLP